MIGSVLQSRYELTGLLTDGAIFASYSARDRAAAKDLCIRVVKPPFSRNTTFLDALKAGITRYGAIRNPHVDQIYELQDDDGSAFLVGELTRGPSLADRIRKLAPFSVPVSVGTAISICQGLEPFHRNGLPHGSLIPSNVVVMADGGVRLQMPAVWEAIATSPTAGAMELPALTSYLAPEVSSGGNPTPSSDVYALGVILYELLSGRLPYYGDTPVAIAVQHSTSPTPNVRSINPSVPVVLDEIVKKAMSKNPADRYASAGEIAVDLRLLQDALRFGRPVSWPLRPTGARPTAAPAKGGAKSEPVAPRMSAIRTEEEYRDSRRRDRPERDIPLAVSIFVAVLGGICVCLVGIWLFFTMNRPKQIAVPNIVGMDMDEAGSVLRTQKLEMRRAGSHPSESVEAGKILEISPDAGTQVLEGASISVITSTGSEFVAVPDLRGSTRDKAKTVLDSLGLDLNPQDLHQPDPQIGEGMIVKSVPEAKSKVNRGAAVQLVISTGPAQVDTSDEPANPQTDSGNGDSGNGDSPNSYRYTLSMVLSDIQKPTEVRVDIIDDSGTRTVYDEDRNQGDRFTVTATAEGKQAVFKVYYDNVPSKTIVKPAEGPPVQQ